MDANQSPQKNVFVVLGMSRSGTSAIARSLSALGVDLGNQLIEADSRNPKGFYEDADILYKINRGVSAAIDYNWIEYGEDEKLIETDSELRDYKNYAVGLLCERFVKTGNWGFKDPRTVCILPFWQAVFKAVNVEDKYILALRNPLASAYSNQKFAKMDLEAGLILWIKILKTMINGTVGKKRVLISYDLMLQNPRLQLDRMQKALAIEEPADEQAIAAYADGFIDKKLQTHHYSDSDIESHPAVTITPIALKMYELAMRVARDEIDFDSAEFQAAWAALEQELATVRPMHAYVELLAKRNKKLERELRTIKKSLPYKLIYPLRVIDNVLRAYRRKSKRLVSLVQAYE